MKQFSRINLYWSKLLLSLSFVVVLNKANCQNNLLTNGSFEYYINSCYFFYNFPPWEEPNNATATYYHFVNCHLFSPQIHLWPKHGNACAGITLMNKPYIDYRQYLSSPMMSTLSSGKSYCVSFYWYKYKLSNYAIKTMGVLFTQDSIQHNNNTYIPLTPQFEHNGAHLTDSTQWNLMQFIYSAQGNENYITIGNFKSDSNCDTLRVKTTGNLLEEYSYYFIDDISVIELLAANAGKDTLLNYGDSTILGGPAVYAAQYQWQPTQGLNCSNCPNPKASPASTTIYTLTLTQCSQITTDTVQISVNGTSINEINKIQVKVYPNPANSGEIINCKIENVKNISLRNVLGQNFNLSFNELNGITKIQLPKIASGVYTLEFGLKNNQVIITKHIIN